MLSTQKAQTGSRVYRGTSTTPNRGQVSAKGAQGYIKRELSKKNQAGVQRRVGGDGKSDNRSAVAAKAMERRREQQHKQQMKHKKALHKYQTQKEKAAAAKAAADAATADAKTKKAEAEIPPPITDEMKPAQQVEITRDGILQLPYDQQFGAEQLAAITGANDELLGLKVEGDQQALEYGKTKRQTDLAYNSLAKQTLNENAASGTAFSSRYGTAVANNATARANEMGDLEMANTNFLQNQNLQRQTIQTALNQQLAALAQQQADNLNADAGTLGYGQDTSPELKSNEPEIQKYKDADAASAAAKKARDAAKKAAAKAKHQKAALAKLRKDHSKKQDRNKLRKKRQRDNKKGGKK